MSQAITASRPRGAHRSDTHDGARITVSDLRSARIHRTGRPRPRPTPRPMPRPTTHARPNAEAPREPVVRSVITPAMRAWMDSRPFWAGLCLLGAGLQIGFWPALGGSQRSGVSEIMFLVLLVSDGLAIWAVPLYRRLLGVQAAALGVLAVTTGNLGGLLIGTSAAILGGAMAFRWQPAEPVPAPRPVERALTVVPPVREAEPAEPIRDAEPDRDAEPECEVERTAELKPAPKLAIVASTPKPEPSAGRHEAPRPRPAANSAEDEQVARAESDEQSFIPGF